MRGEPVPNFFADDPNGGRIVNLDLAGSQYQAASKIWDLQTRAGITSTPAIQQGLLYAADDAGNIYAINADTRAPVWPLKQEGREEGGLMCPSWRVTHEEEHSTRGRAHLLWEMTQSTREDAIIRDRATGRELTSFQGHKAGVSGVAVSADGRTLATAGWDRTVKVWHLLPPPRWWQPS